MLILNSGPGNYVINRGKRYSYFGGNNYLGLAGHPDVKKAAIEAVEKYGVNFSASRRTSGTADIHLELEQALAKFKGKDDTVVYASGYLGNSIILEALTGKYSIVFTDKAAHSSIRSALNCSACEKYFYEHLNSGDLDLLMKKHPSDAPLVITDGVFALSGEIAPLGEIYSVARKHNARLIVDDAHSTGILGKTGKGTPEYFGLVADDYIFQTETMSKAIGSYGGFISCSNYVAELIREHSAAYQASTSLPPAVVAAGLAAVRIIENQPELRTSLLKKAAYLRSEIVKLGFTTSQSEAPVIPLIFNDRDTALSLNRWLDEQGIIVPYMNYPSAHEQYMLRLAVTAIHEMSRIDELLDRLKKWISAT